MVNYYTVVFNRMLMLLTTIVIIVIASVTNVTGERMSVICDSVIGREI